MSSILDALRKLEEEKPRQIRLIQFDEVDTNEPLFDVEEDGKEEVNKSTFIFEPQPVESHVDTKPKVITLTSRVLITFMIAFGFVIVGLTTAISLIVVKTQVGFHHTDLAKLDSGNSSLSSATAEGIKQNEEVTTGTPVIEHQENTVTPVKSVQATSESNVSVKSSEMTKEKSVQLNPPISKEPTRLAKKSVDKPTLSREIGSSDTDAFASTGSKTAIVSAVNPPEGSNTLAGQSADRANEDIQGMMTLAQTSSTENSNSANSSESEPRPPQPQIPATVQPTYAKPVVTPAIMARELEPPPSLRMEQFQQKLASNNRPNEPLNIQTLPVMKTSDKIRLGLDRLQLNVLREASAKNPYGLAIINLNKVYVGEIIPGTSVRLIDVKTHGIAVEVLGTGERYYLPR